MTLQKPRLWIGLAGFALLLLLLKVSHVMGDKKALPVVTPMLIRQDHRIVIPEQSPLRHEMSVQTVRSHSRPHWISLPGVVEADPTQMVRIFPPLLGRLDSVWVNWGDVVHKGQVLAVIRSPDLAQAVSDNETAKSRLTFTRRALERAQAVSRAGGNAIKDVQQAQQDLTQATAEAQRSALRLKTLGRHDLAGFLTIKAPMSGRVVELNAANGLYITDQTASLLSIANLDMVWVAAQVPESLAGLVRPGQPVNMQFPAYPNETFRGTISFVSAVLDPATHRNKTYIAMPNSDGKLQPNMYATVQWPAPQPKVVMIPLSAIQMNDDTTSVYVETAPWTFQQRAVELGLEDGDLVRVVAGLESGERIAAYGGMFIND